MAELKYNEPFFTLVIDGLPQDTVQIDSYAGEEQISHLFEYRFNLYSENEELVKLYGIITHFEQRGRSDKYVFYYVVLSPKLWRLSLFYQSEIYQNMDISTLIRRVLESSGFSRNDYEINLSETYPQQEYIVQYRETNLNFLNRRLEHFGIYYYFDHRDKNDIVVFTDTNYHLPSIGQSEPILYHSKGDPLAEKEIIRSFTSQEKVVTGFVRLKDYNYLYPEKQLMAESRIDQDAPGLYYEYGDHFEDDNQAAFLARIRNEEIIAASRQFLGSSDCRLMHAGMRFAISEHYRRSWDGEYLLTWISSRGSQKGLKAFNAGYGDHSSSYENSFVAIPADIPFRPQRRTPVPLISGIMSAKTESATGDEYAYIDEHGRYHAKMLFDLAERRNGEATLAIRQIQPYSGPGYGTHFPSHADTELVWACVDGNVDRPISLGTVPNPSNISPSVMMNKAQSVIRTAGQNELTMDDTTQHENIYLHGTKDWTIDIVNDKRQKIGHDEFLHIFNSRAKIVEVEQSEKIGKNKIIEVGKDHTESIGENKQLHVGKNYSCYSGEKMSFHADNDFYIYGDRNGYIEMKDKLILKCGSSSITLKSNGEITIKGSKILIKASGDIVIKGAHIKEN